ncbi:MAG: hypothetical protein GY809_19695 [Planctomycetes bacterium]|nr:hypothetical protein [Planctomycetota bacterium]
MNKGAEKTPQVTPKSFLAVGPTLHYSHENVLIFWFLAVIVFALTCLFWSKTGTGSFAAFDAAGVASIKSWHLDRFVLSGISIYEYPWQILVLGFLMGVMGITPVLVSQLMSFSHCLPFLLSILFLANLPGFALALGISCVGVACRPLRFRSRIISVALCMAPQLGYWGYFGGARDYEALLWGMSFGPWVCAWLVGLIIAGVVLTVGHFTRYKPGLIWITSGVFLGIAVSVFQAKIGFNELAYQLHVVNNAPEEVSQFHDHNIKDDFDAVLENPKVKAYLDNFFYPTELSRLREELKQEMIKQLGDERWPEWFVASGIPEHLDFLAKRHWLDLHYDLFIDPAKSWWMPDFMHRELLRRRMASKRMAVALYYKGLLSEYSPDLAWLRDKEVLRFSSDYPLERSRLIWDRLFREFPDQGESLEARWRIAMHWAGQGRFEEATGLLNESRTMLAGLITEASAGREPDGATRYFRPPAQTVMTRVKFTDLQTRLNRLFNLIGPENRGEDTASLNRLAEFIKLNALALDYPKRLNAIMELLGPEDCLRDNVALAQAKSIADAKHREERLGALHREYANTDGGIEALFELGLLKTNLYKNHANSEEKGLMLQEAVDTLENFLKLYPDSPLSTQVKELITRLPVSKSPAS